MSSRRVTRSRLARFAALIALATLLATLVPGQALGATPSLTVLQQSGPLAISGNNVYGNVASVPLATGRWLVLAKLEITFVHANQARALTTCVLSTNGTGGWLDQLNVAPPRAATNGTGATGIGETISLSVADTFSAPGAASLNCKTDAAPNVVFWRQLRITAIPVAKLIIGDLNGSLYLTSGSGSPEAIWAYSSATKIVSPGGNGDSALLQMPQGRWVNFASMQIDAVSASAWGDCSPHGTGGGASSYWNTTSAGTPGDIQANSSEYQFDDSASAGAQGIVCTTGGGDVKISNMTIAALREGRVSFSYAGHITQIKGKGTPIVITGYRLYRQPVPAGAPQRLWGPMHLRSGNWLVSTDLDVLSDGAGTPPVVHCRLRVGSQAIDMADTRLEGTLGTGHPRQNLALLGAVSQKAPGSVTVACGHSGSSGVKLRGLVINAVKVGPITAE